MIDTPTTYVAKKGQALEPRRNFFGGGYGFNCPCGEPMPRLKHAEEPNAEGVHVVVQATCLKGHVWNKVWAETASGYASAWVQEAAK